MKRSVPLASATLSALLLATFALPATAQQTLTYPQLVDRMIDLEHLAVLPEKGETCAQCSSYDRASRYDEATGKYVGWDANGDGGQMIRKEGDQWVMAEMEGPGCIWRIWSATSNKGHVKIYLDGQEQPAVDLPFREYFTGKTAPFNYPSLSYHNADQGSRGENLYYPIPYQKSCKIVADDGWGAYYHFTYSTFPQGTKVPTFSAELSPEGVAALQRVDTFFHRQLGNDPAGARDGQETIAQQVQIGAGETLALEIDGPRAITAIKGNMRFADREDEMAALRRLVLRITFDGEQEPDVCCPLGDFFGTAPGKNLYKCLTTGMTEEGVYAYWYMPFARGAKVELVNEDEVARNLGFEITHAPLARSFEGLGHFHCKWHRDVWPLSEDRRPDWVMLRTEGRGRFCGVMLHVWNPRGGWWGEGDEKFFLDGEKFPSTIGTGSEDYFGYAWCHPGLFQHPYHCQTMTENNRGHQSVLRWHIGDNVPFQTSFEAAIEKYYPNSGGTLYACVPCFYLAPGQSDGVPPTPVDQRDGYYEKLPPSGGGYKVSGEPRGEVQDQGMGAYGSGKWHNDNQLWWTGARPGDKMDIVFPVKKAGAYQVSVTLTKAVDYGIVQLWVDGKKAGEPIDLFHDGVVPTGPIALGTYELAEGNHQLTVEIVGANEKAVKAYMFGLDQILLKSAK
ncbi:MAG: DUF2961 domain-containing protein [Pirellulales bacterium]|nr:DUF2961 domain-containing protein [Pirellulales bacterium]